MTTDYIVASLPTLSFGAPPPITRDAFDALAGDAVGDGLRGRWADIETQLRNAVAEARGGGERFRRPAKGCSLYWKKRIADCFAEHDVAKRDELIDRVWWDAADELSDCANPLGKGALATYSVRLDIAIRRAKISREGGGAAFDRLTADTKDIL